MKPIALAVPCVLLAGCATVARSSAERLAQRAPLEDGSDVLLVVDACIRRDVIGEDFFVVNRARDGAGALLSAASQYLAVYGLTAHDGLVPFVCGALHDAGNAPKKVASALGADLQESAQPFAVTSTMVGDAEYVSALQVLATYVHQTEAAKLALAAAKARAAAAPDDSFGHDPSSAVQGGEPDRAPEAESALPWTVDPDRARAAAAVVGARSRRASALVIVLAGNSLSAGKSVAMGTARFTASLAVGVATGLASGVVVVPVFPGGGDGYLATAGLVDLRTGALVQSGAVFGAGDPMDPAVFTQRDTIDLLLRGVLFSKAAM